LHIAESKSHGAGMVIAPSAQGLPKIQEKVGVVNAARSCLAGNDRI
jgi:hypothetical protein